MPKINQSFLNTIADDLSEKRKIIDDQKKTIEELKRENHAVAMEAHECLLERNQGRNKIRELEDRLADCAQQKNAEPDTTNLFLLGAQKKLCEAKEQRIQELTRALEDLEKQHKDPTMPETPTKLEAYWQGRAYADKQIQELAQERDALKNRIQMFFMGDPDRSHNDEKSYIEALATENASIQKALFANQNANKNLCDKISELEKERDALELKLKHRLFPKEHTASEFAVLQNDLACERSLRESLAMSNERLEKERDALKNPPYKAWAKQGELNQCKAKIAALEIDKKNAYMIIHDIRSEKEQLGYEVQDLQKQLSDLRTEMNKPICPTPGEIATASKSAELEKELAHKNHIIRQHSEANDWQAKKIAELEKLIPQYQPIRPIEDSDRIAYLEREKASYENVIQEMREQIEEFKANNRYHRGHTAGYAEAVENIKTFLQTRK